MPVTATHLLTGESNGDGSAYNTASFTPPANQLIIAFIAGTDNAGTVTTPTLTGCNLTWVWLAEGIRGTKHVTAFRAMGASPTTGAVSIANSSSQLDCLWSFVAFDNVPTTGTHGSDAVVQAVPGNFAASTGATITLAALADSGNATAGAFLHAANEASTPGMDYSELGDVNHSGPVAGFASEWRADGNTTVNMSWATSSISAGVAIEIAASAAGPITLTVQDASHTHQADSPALTQANVLAVQDASHNHTADNLALTQANTLVVADSSHDHTAESPTLSEETMLVVQSAEHGHEADSPTLTQANTLSVSDSTHDHQADNVGLVQANTLSVDSAEHGHEADSPELTHDMLLVVQDTQHGHTVDSPALTQANVLAVDDASHAQTAESPALTQANILAVDGSTHSHVADNMSLSQATTLSVDSAEHGHYVDNVTLETPPPPPITFILGGNSIRRPHEMEDSHSTQYAENRVLDGDINRDFFGDDKRVWQLVYRNATPDEYQQIKAAYANYLATNDPATWEVTGVYYTVDETLVHIDLIDRGFTASGTHYLSNFMLVLTEV